MEELYNNEIWKTFWKNKACLLEIAMVDYKDNWALDVMIKRSNFLLHITIKKKSKVNQEDIILKIHHISDPNLHVMSVLLTEYKVKKGRTSKQRKKVYGCF